jgi:2-succinyl-6-hydroxy-2,4-cyclohexadiene-1-carboxylate synthase
LSQTADMWDRVAGAMPARHPATPIDVVTKRSFEDTAVDLVSRRGPGAYVGYSMGGRLALCAALEQPEPVQALVLVSASPGISDHAERRRRQLDDEALAGWIEAHTRAEFLQRWLSQPLFATLDAPAATGSRLESTFEIAEQLRVLGQGAQRSLWDALPRLEMPVLLVAGGLDERYVAIAAEMLSEIGMNAEMAVVPGAGHAVPLELPESLAECITGFLDRHSDPHSATA